VTGLAPLYVHRWCGLSERSPVDQAVTGKGRDRGRNTPRRGSCTRKGSGDGNGYYAAPSNGSENGRSSILGVGRKEAMFCL